MARRKNQSATFCPAITPLPAATIRVGIDWADGQHEYVMMDPRGALHRGSFEQTPEGSATLLDSWQRDFPNVMVEVCLETSRGPIIDGLLEHHQVRIYPVNPNALANYRKAFAHGGGKNDPVDANLILQFFLHYREQLHELKPNSPLTRELRPAVSRSTPIGRATRHVGAAVENAGKRLLSRDFGSQASEDLRGLHPPPAAKVPDAGACPSGWAQ